ncbi:NADH-quinone oxidoreductase subunit K [Actinospica robiniae]|uniref:NADH-quinone oxidoreductase subunit K n=1 Tax=Actinospica robiniae TaxID=304901 RepID=UPI00041CAF5A|nr:NADH-quinone oxidoreductase subunit K [Actinospica robiniae]
MSGSGTSLTLVLTGGLLVACGVYLLLAPSLTRLVLGFILAGNGLNVLILAAGGLGPADALTQAMILTAIVITLGMAAYLLALAYRTWQLSGDDLVQDDVEDRRIANAAHRIRLRRELSAQRAEYRAERKAALAIARHRRQELRDSLHESRRELRARARLERAIAARAEDYEYLEEETETDTDFTRPPNDSAGGGAP